MCEVLKNGRVIYGIGEERKSAAKLLADGTQVVSPGFGFRVEPKATDLRRVIPKRPAAKQN
jgi:hypothetical protein